jgi:acyl dehydratase
MPPATTSGSTSTPNELNENRRSADPSPHGYLSLSLLPMLGWQIYTVEGAKMGINYGSNKVRFPAPVPVGARLRLRSTLQGAEQLPDGTVQMIVNQVLEIDGHPKPAVVAETISRVAF